MNRRKKTGVMLMALSVLVIVAGAGLTVWQLTFGVGQFSDFLRGEVTEQEIKQQVDVITNSMAVAWLYLIAGFAVGLTLGIGGLVVFLMAPPAPPPLPTPDENARGNRL